MDSAYQCYIISPISGKTGEVCWLHVDLMVSLRQFQSHSQSASHIVAAGALYWAALSVAERDPISSCQHGLGEAKNISGSWGDELWWTQCTWLKIEHDGTVWNNMNTWQKKELYWAVLDAIFQDPSRSPFFRRTGCDDQGCTRWIPSWQEHSSHVPFRCSTAAAPHLQLKTSKKEKQDGRVQGGGWCVDNEL